MKLSSLLPSSSKMKLVHPTMDELSIYWEVTGHDTKAFRDKAREFMADQLKNRSKEIDIEKSEKQDIELLAQCVIGWSDEEMFGPFSTQAVIEHLSNPGLKWIKEQLEVYVQDRQNFFRGDTDQS